MNIAAWLHRAGLSHPGLPAVGKGPRAVQSYGELAERALPPRERAAPDGADGPATASRSRRRTASNISKPSTASGMAASRRCRRTPSCTGASSATSSNIPARGCASRRPGSMLSFKHRALLFAIDTDETIWFWEPDSAMFDAGKLRDGTRHQSWPTRRQLACSRQECVVPAQEARIDAGHERAATSSASVAAAVSATDRERQLDGPCVPTVGDRRSIFRARLRQLQDAKVVGGVKKPASEVSLPPRSCSLPTEIWPLERCGLSECGLSDEHFSQF